MSTRFRELGTTIRRLRDAAGRLERATQILQLPPLAGREWYELLEQKLVPQLHDDAFLVVAVVGGTNIGKSVVFNHLAGTRASSTSPLASGTKHPVCLVPPAFAEQHDLDEIFRGFELLEWRSPDAALEEHTEHRIYWQTSQQVPPSLLVLDTPDIDSDAPVNWQRADMIRRSADVLIAVLTQQKYNDAAVKQFFRRAAGEEKAIIVLFNQCQLPEDDAYWPLWMQTFGGETGVRPEIVYVAPNDRRAAEENRLPFYERPWPIAGHEEALAAGEYADARSLSDDLARLRFGEIKLQTLRGSLKFLLDREAGVPEYLAEVRLRSAEFQAASRMFSDNVVRISDWPAVPNRLLVDEIRRWWRANTEGWARTVHGFYNALGTGVTWPIRFAREQLQGPQVPPIEQYRRQEWTAVLRAIEEWFEKLTLISESGSDLLQPHFRRLLDGAGRTKLIETLRAEHEAVPLQEELEEAVKEEMQQFKTGSPELYGFYKRLNEISAAARPAASVVLFTLGFGPAGEALAQAAAHTILPVVVDFAGGTAAAVAGETAISSAAGQGSGYLQIKFQKLHTRFAARRASWLAERLKVHLLGTLPEQLQSAADVPQSDVYRELSDTLDLLARQLGAQQQEAAA